MFGLLIFVSRKASFEFVIMFNNTCESSLSKPYINISWESVLFILILLLLKLSSIRKMVCLMAVCIENSTFSLLG